MSDRVLYRERLPRYVFNGVQVERGRVRLVQWWYRLGAIAMICMTLYLIYDDPGFERSVNPMMFGLCMVLTWFVCAYLLYRSEFDHQAQLDGSLATIVYDDRITIPPRLRRRLTGRPDQIPRQDVDHVEVVRGGAGQVIERRDVVFWEAAPIGLRIVTFGGKSYGLGYKPPNEVMGIVDTLRTQWGVRVKDSGMGMGRGGRYRRGEHLWDLSYERIVAMDLFEWQD